MQSNETEREACRVGGIKLDARTCSFYRQAMTILAEAEVPALVGGAYALERYTEVSRHTKDFDVFIRAGRCRACPGGLLRCGLQV